MKQDHDYRIQGKPISQEDDLTIFKRQDSKGEMPEMGGSGINAEHTGQEHSPWKGTKEGSGETLTGW